MLDTATIVTAILRYRTAGSRSSEAMENKKKEDDERFGPAQEDGVSHND
jgi:hypothetical protein